MKKVISILFLLVILFQSSSKLWIMGAFYLNRDYIAKNLCINRFDAMPICKGQCYLAKELKENEKQEQKVPDLKQKEIQLYCQQKELFTETTYTELAENTIPASRFTCYKSNFHVSIFHPPQAA